MTKLPHNRFHYAVLHAKNFTKAMDWVDAIMSVACPECGAALGDIRLAIQYFHRRCTH